MSIVWIAGIAGFLGGNAARRFLAEGWTVVGIGNPRRFGADELAVSNLRGRQALVEGLLTIETLEAAFAMAGPPDVVVHAAGSGAVSASFSKPLEDFERAVTTTAILLEVLRRRAPNARLILASSAAVYGVCSASPIGEDDPLAPVSPYGAHKLMAELLCRQAHINFGQSVAVLRLFSLYGPGMQKQLLWDLCERLRPRPSELTMDGTGGEVRDFLFIDDAVELIWLAGCSAINKLLVNGGTGQATTVRDVAENLIRRVSPETRLIFTGKIRSGDPSYLCADTARMKNIGFFPKIGLEEGLNRYIQWLHKIDRLS
jgi:UDP-glucose 4-epimerase